MPVPPDAIGNRPSASRDTIHRMIDRYHVGTSSAEIEQAIRDRCSAAVSLGKCTTGFVNALVRIAHARHESNRNIYRKVTSGDLS